MKIALVTNYQDTCGIAIYGENLIKYFPEDVEFSIIPPSSLEYALKQAQGCDLIHLNYHEGLRFGFSIPEFIKQTNLPAILTNHTTTYDIEWYNLLKAVITHIPAPQFGERNRVVSQPILDLEFDNPGPSKMILSQAGFPFPWKNYPLICEAAVKTGLNPDLLFFMPDTYHYNTFQEINRCKLTLGNSDIKAEFVTDWLDDVSLVTRMHNEASVMVYYTGEKKEGPSASVRLGIASKHPVVVNGNAYQYQDILEEEGIYPCYKDEDLPFTIIKAFNDGKYAKDLISRQSYVKVGAEYYSLYKEVLNA